MISNFDALNWLITVIGVPFGLYVQKQIDQSKEDRLKQKEELSSFKIFCAEHYAKNEAIESLRKEIKEELSDIKTELRNSLERIENKVEHRTTK